MEVTVGQIVWTAPQYAGPPGVAQVVEDYGNGMFCVYTTSGRLVDVENEELTPYTGPIGNDWFEMANFPLPAHQANQLVDATDVPYPRGAAGQGLQSWMSQVGV